MRACRLDCLRYVERELAPLVTEPDQVGRSDQVSRASGTDVRYTTVYPVPDTRRI